MWLFAAPGAPFLLCNRLVARSGKLNIDRQNVSCVTIGKAAESNPIGIQLRDRHHSLTRGPSGAVTAQMICVLETFEIIYSSRYASRFSDAVCRYWIAHELAHVYLRVNDSSHGSEYEAAEAEVARLLVNAWAFSEDDESDLEVERYLVDQDVAVR